MPKPEVPMVMTALLLVTLLQNNAPRTQSSFHSIGSFRCSFDSSEGRNMDASVSRLPSGKMDGIVFDSIDYSKGTGRMIGNAGATDVSAIRGMFGGSLIEITAGGNVILTTIFSRPAEKGDEMFNAVMSRHIGTGAGAAIVSQFYGTCKGLH
jgi:hypothetical protein